MNNHLEQAKHNKNFHDSIEAQFKDQFFDWKITVLFYIAIHYLKALAAHKRIDIGETHFDIEHNVNPDRHHAKMRITKGAWREYKNLFNYSRTARYEGIYNLPNFEKLKQLDHTYCVMHLENFKKYVQGQGLTLDN